MAASRYCRWRRRQQQQQSYEINSNTARTEQQIGDGEEMMKMMMVIEVLTGRGEVGGNGSEEKRK